MEWGRASLGEAQNRLIFGGITEIPHWAVMGELTHGSEKKACAVFEKYVIYTTRLVEKVHIPYLETHPYLDTCGNTCIIPWVTKR